MHLIQCFDTEVELAEVALKQGPTRLNPYRVSADPGAATPTEAQQLHLLTLLTLAPEDAEEALPVLSLLDERGRSEFLELADSHHVVIRAFEAIRTVALPHYRPLREWAMQILETEEARIANALRHLSAITEELEKHGCPTTVMKSLDHWPDLGNDLDLYTTAPEAKVVAVMKRRFHATIEPRSWGDRLAKKWNFAVPGLRESVEAHVQRLGQTGEHTALAERFVSRRQMLTIAGYSFFVPAPEERLIVVTLQRMYRHFYARVCDLANTVTLVNSGAVNWTELRKASERAGIWPGVATYLNIVSDYHMRYRGIPLHLPEEVKYSARFGGKEVAPKNRFLRIPIVPHASKLYVTQLGSTLKRGDMNAVARLSLLPPLASVAAVAYKMTGSDKGIW